MRVEDTEDGDTVLVSGRGLLHLTVLIETMRREGFELMVGPPTVIEKNIDGERMEPFELVRSRNPPHLKNGLRVLFWAIASSGGAIAFLCLWVSTNRCVRALALTLYAPYFTTRWTLTSRRSTLARASACSMSARQATQMYFFVACFPLSCHGSACRHPMLPWAFSHRTR